MNGTFPNYAQLIPQGHSTRMVVSVAEFLRATKTASIFARDGSGIVRLVMTPGGELTAGKLTVSARSEEIGDDVGEIDAAVEGGKGRTRLCLPPLLRSHAPCSPGLMPSLTVTY